MVYDRDSLLLLLKIDETAIRGLTVRGICGCGCKTRITGIATGIEKRQTDNMLSIYLEDSYPAYIGSAEVEEIFLGDFLEVLAELDEKN